ncbi:MAG: hypothetical protein BJ554DRAFT_2731 [Olpidium bornovanus]|uniref:Uncharacterized protein n=1 Tax=Olpidium bornovanus TaxID=278681 RepID=A0A8H8DG28_9FUNG|nr:MAG: hypothetical protein BJ554DRAFT_2731 [Olpidium bornovanus]
MTATVAFWPAGRRSYPINSIVLLFTIGCCGYTIKYNSVSIRFSWLYAIAPIACFPMAHWYVLRGLWLWCGYGIKPATAPRIVNGSISRCVVPRRCSTAPSSSPSTASKPVGAL